VKLMFGRVVGPGVLPEGADAFRVLVDAIVDAQRNQRVRAGDPMALAMFAWASVHGLATLTIEGALDRLDPTRSASVRAGAAIDLIMDALAPR
jgi:hypothetical protein